MGQRGYCRYLHRIACLIRALMLRWTREMGHVLENWEQGTQKRKYLQITSISLYLEPLQVRCICQLTQKESVGFALKLAGAGGDRGQRVPHGIAGVGRRKSVCSSTSLRSHRKESRRCFGELHSTFSSAGLRQWCAYTHWLAQRWSRKGELSPLIFFFSTFKFLNASDVTAKLMSVSPETVRSHLSSAFHQKNLNAATNT